MTWKTGPMRVGERVARISTARSGSPLSRAIST